MKKKVFVVALAVCLIASLSLGTLAWFTDKDSATNDFNIGGAGQGESDKIFSVEVKENVDGEDEPVDSMAFGNVLPGDKFKKEAFITNTGSYDQYIRVIMTITDWELIEGLVTINMDDAFDANWHIYDGQARVQDDVLVDFSNTELDDDGNLVVTMYLNKKLAAGETVQIMDYVSISTKATQNDFTAEGFADGFQIHIKADAAQTENILEEYGAVEWQNAKKTFAALEG